MIGSGRLLGPNKLVAYALNEWLTDIRKNQLPSVLGGVGPMHSIVQLGTSLDSLPVGGSRPPVGGGRDPVVPVVPVRYELCRQF